MKKVLLTLISVVIISAIGFAQKGHNQIGIAAEVGFPTSDFGKASKTGFGGSVKGLLGVGTAGQVTFTSGYTAYGFKNLPAGYSGHTSIVPLLLGYRHNFSGFFIEPQAGYGIYKGKLTGGGVTTSSSNGAFTWAVGVGYAMNGFEAGIRYQSASVSGTTIGLVGIHVGYNFTLAASK